MANSLLDATRVFKATEAAISVLSAEDDKSEVNKKKTLMLQRISALAKAASETEGNNRISLISEEFWLISKFW